MYEWLKERLDECKLEYSEGTRYRNDKSNNLITVRLVDVGDSELIDGILLEAMLEYGSDSLVISRCGSYVGIHVLGINNDKYL